MKKLKSSWKSHNINKKRIGDKIKKFINFQVGDMVLLYHEVQSTKLDKSTLKLASLYTGPFKIARKFDETSLGTEGMN